MIFKKLLKVLPQLYLALLPCSPAMGFAATYNLTIAPKAVTINGKTVEKMAINNQIPAPTLHFTEGEHVVINATNAMKEPSSIHWHGLLVPAKMDGVPGFNNFGMGILPGSTFTYRFTVKQNGTYWYHSHSGLQEQEGLYGAIVIKPLKADPVQADRDYIVMLSDFSTTPAPTILGRLKRGNGYYHYTGRTLGDFIHDIHANGWHATLKDRLAWGRMRMDPTDITDVSGYQFLVNGKTPKQNWTALFKPGQKVRLRFINASSMSFYDVRIPGLKMTVVQADGRNVQPVAVDEFRIGIAETYDVVVQPNNDKAYSIVAEPLDRSGFARATLAPHEGMVGPAPKHRPLPLLTMNDMPMQATEGHTNATTMDMEHAMPMQHAMHHDMASMGNMQGMNTAMMETPAPPTGWAGMGTPKGEKALSYADLRSLTPQPDTRQPDRTIKVELGGNMERYVWTINGKTFDEAKPIVLRYKERVRLKFINNTMMAHPMHLHGMFMQLENGQPAKWMPDKHTVIVPPGGTYSTLLTANAPGEWAFHCHMLYHMASGMMSKVVVATLPKGAIPPSHTTPMKPMDMEGYNHAR